jgi:hypothetical protein
LKFYLNKYSINFFEVIIIFLILQKIIASILGPVLGNFITLLDELFYLIIFIITIYKKDVISKNISILFLILIGTGFISVFINKDIHFSFLAGMLGILFYFNIYNIVIFRNFNFLESRVLYKFFYIITILIFLSIIFQVINIDGFFKLREVLGLKFNDNNIGGIVPFPTIFYGLWESAIVGIFLFYYWIFYFKERKKTIHLFFITVSIFTIILSFRLTENIVLLISLFYLINKKWKVISASFLLIFISFNYSNLDKNQKEILDKVIFEKTRGYLNPDPNDLPLRNQLYYASFEVLKNRFPLGMGPGNFSNNSSQIFIKNTIKNHSDLKSFAIPIYNSNILGDSGYSMIAGEFGFIGVIIYSFFIISLFFKIFLNKNNLSPNHLIFVQLTFFYFIIGMIKGNYHFYTLFSILFISQFAYLYRNNIRS